MGQFQTWLSLGRRPGAVTEGGGRPGRYSMPKCSTARRPRATAIQPARPPNPQLAGARRRPAPGLRRGCLVHRIATDPGYDRRQRVVQPGFPAAKVAAPTRRLGQRQAQAEQRFDPVCLHPAPGARGLPVLHEALFERLGRRTHVDAVSAGKAPGRGDIAVAENGVDRAAAPSCCRPSGQSAGRPAPAPSGQTAARRWVRCRKRSISLQRAGCSRRRCCLALVPLAQFLQREGCQLQPWRVLPQLRDSEQGRPAQRKGPRSGVQPWIVAGKRRIGSVIVVQSLVCPWPVSAACSAACLRRATCRNDAGRQTPLRRVE